MYRGDEQMEGPAKEMNGRDDTLAEAIFLQSHLKVLQMLLTKLGCVGGEQDARLYWLKHCMAVATAHLEAFVKLRKEMK